jgi:hypothetical protein
MKRIAIVAFLAIGVGAAAVGAAGARVTHYPTTLTVQGLYAGPMGGPPPSVFIEFGRVQSPNHACRSGRHMQMVAEYADGSHKLLDTGRSSQSGAYALLGDFEDATGATIKALRKRTGKRGHHKVCNAKSIPAD